MSTSGFSGSMDSGIPETNAINRMTDDECVVALEQLSQAIDLCLFPFMTCEEVADKRYRCTSDKLQHFLWRLGRVQVALDERTRPYRHKGVSGYSGAKE